MLLSTDQLNAQYDSFVIGSGPAGMTIAIELAKAKKRVLVFESGESTEPRTDIPAVLNYGHLPAGWWNRHSQRALGGTSNVWGGWCASLSAWDFDNPAASAHWPIGLNDLLPFYQRAAPILDRDPSIVNFEPALLPGFVYRPFSVREDSPTRFALKYKKELDESAVLHVALGCSVVGLDANDGRSAVRTLSYFHHPTGNRHTLAIRSSQHVVVAGGGIGTPHLLLQPRLDGGVPVGNESGQVGKFVMEHPHFLEAAECVLDADLDGHARPAQFGNPVHALVVDGAFAKDHGLLACSIACQDQSPDHEIARYLSQESGRTFFHYMCTLRSEMRASANNRVFLTGERDRTGFYGAGVRCVLDADDYLNVETTLRLLGESLIQRRKGRVRIFNSRIYHDVVGGGHLMGTTRMGTNRSTSVVDADCRVHGYNNLHIAGSSVFPSCGYANPTLTLVALAVRLADRLKVN
jgi:hypothetical protein